MSYEDMVVKMTPKLRAIVGSIRWRSGTCDDGDLLQEALVHLWTLWKRGDLDGKTDSFILQGCYFHIKNYLRREMRRKEGGQIFTFDRPVKGKDLTPCLECGVWLDSLRVLLDGRERKVLALVADGYTMREIAREQGVSHVMVVKIVRGIREKARRLPAGDLAYLYM